MKVWSPVSIEADKMKVLAWPDDAKVLFSLQNKGKQFYIEGNLLDLALTHQEAREIAQQLIEAAEDVERPVNE